MSDHDELISRLTSLSLKYMPSDMYTYRQLVEAVAALRKQMREAPKPELELFTVRALLAQLIAALLSAKTDLETAQREIKGVAPEASAPSLPIIRTALTAYEEIESTFGWVK